MNLDNQKIESRIEWADIFKGIVIVLVVIGHATGKFNTWIYQFHMAAFFFISGYLSNITKRSDVSMVVKKCCTILLPYFSLGLVGILLNAVFSKTGLHEFLFGSEYIGIGIAVKEMFLKGNIYVQYWGTFWFLIALFGVELLHIICYQLNRKKLNIIYFIVSAILFIMGYAFVKNGVTPRIWIVDVDQVLIAQFYYTIGLFVRMVKAEQNLMNGKIIAHIVCAIAAIVISVWGVMNGVVVDLVSRRVNTPGADFVVAFASIYIIIFLSLLISRHTKYIKKPFVICGKNSLGIMVFHFVLFKIFFVLLYKLGIAEAMDIVNVVPTEELSNKYWIVLSVWAIVGSLILWCGITKVPVIRICLGQDAVFNYKVCSKIGNASSVVRWGNICTTATSHGWEKIISFIKKNKKYVTFTLVCVILVVIPLYRTGIILNDELQARCLALQGFWDFVKTNFAWYVRDGRVLAAPIDSITMFFGFIGAGQGTSFKIFQILILLAIVLVFGLFIYKILKNKFFATFASLLSLVCMPITFEHVAPNAFVGLFGIPFILLFLSFILYIDYIEKNNKWKIIASMIMFFVAQMSYETFITYVVLYFMIAIGKTGLKNLKENLCLYLIPFFTAVLYLLCYVISGVLSPSLYSGNTLGFVSILSSLEILISLFVASIPGFYVLLPRYQSLKEYYYNLETFDYFRVFLFAISFAIVCLMLLRKTGTNKDVVKYKRERHIYFIFCGLCYMILPSLPISVSAMYQGNVGRTGFLSLPVNFFEYFAAIFVVAYLIWHICRYIGKYFYIVITMLLCLLTINIQMMNDIFSKEQNRNFNRLVKIEEFLQTETVKNLGVGEYVANDLYLQQNTLAIHSGYWTTYCNDVLGIPLEITDVDSDDKAGYIFYDGDNFAIVNNANLTVLSFDREEFPKAVKVSNDEYMLFDFDNEIIDGNFYVYSKTNDGTLYSVQGYNAIQGSFPDGWLEKESLFLVTTGEKGKIHLSLYYPGTNFEGKLVRLFTNGECVEEVKLDDANVCFELDTQPNETLELSIECSFEYEDKGEDIRELAIVLSEFDVE